MTPLRSMCATLVVAGACLASEPVEAAGKFDGSTPMLCVPVVVNECLPDGACQRRNPEAVNLPQFLRVDLAAKQVHAVGVTRVSPIRNVEHIAGNLIVQGGQDGRGWTFTVSEETGRMSAAIAADNEGFILFGACTIP